MGRDGGMRTTRVRNTGVIVRNMGVIGMRVEGEVYSALTSLQLTIGLRRVSNKVNRISERKEMI